MTYGSVIKQAREEHRLTQEQLAEELDISRQAVSKWEADLSKPAREKLDRLSEILDIPPDTWGRIDAENAPSTPDPHAARPWMISTAVLAAVCLALAVALFAALRPKTNVDVPRPLDVELPTEEETVSSSEPDPAPSIPETIPLGVKHDYAFGDWPLGEYDPAEIPFLDDGEQVMAHELWAGWFPDGTRLGLVKCAAQWDESQERSNLYIIWAPPVETTGGELDCHILYRVGEDYMGEDSGDPEAVPFENVLGFDGFKLTVSAAENLYRVACYFAQRDDGSVCMVTSTGVENGVGEADVDEDGVLEIAYYDQYARGWKIIDTKKGEEGAFEYLLSDDSWVTGRLSSDPYISGFDPNRQGFITIDASNTVLARYALRNGEMVKTPDTDFSVDDYPDAAGTEITFVTDAEVLSDGLGPDVILPYNPEVRITHRQQAYIALQELYNLTGLTVDACYCAAGDFGVVFSLLEDGFNHRSFYAFYPNGSLGSYSEESNIASMHIDWRELEGDWSPLAFADAVKADGDSTAEKMRQYYDRLSALHTDEAAECSFPEPIEPAGIYTGEIWLENGDLCNVMYQLVDGEPALCSLYGPYPDGIVNH